MREALIGRDPVFLAAAALAGRAAPGKSPVLIVGPIGSGKSHLARWIHARGPNPSAPFREWDAGAVPATLFEAELFGVEAGAATEVSARPGIFEAAGEGTLCLAGLERIPSGQQASLLRVLEERGIVRVGGTMPRPVRARVIAVFHEAPEGLVQGGVLRPDLLYRLDVMRVELPSLGERPGDVLPLLIHFMKRARRSRRSPLPAVEPELIRALAGHAWGGNLRELKAVAESLILSGSDPVTAEDLPAHFWSRGEIMDEGLRGRMTLEEIRDAYIRRVLARVGGNRSVAARWLGISRKTLWEHLKRPPR